MHSIVTAVIIFSNIFVLSSSQSILSLIEERISKFGKEDNYSNNIEENSDFKYDVLATKDHHTAAFLQCHSNQDGYKVDKSPKCNLTVETRVLQNEINTKSCTFKRIARKRASLAEFKVISTDRVLVHWMEDIPDDRAYMLYQVISTDSCKSSRIFNITSKSYPLIVRRKNNYDLIFTESPRCPENTYCKKTFNVDGEPMNKGFQTLYPEIKSFFINFVQASDYESDDGLFIVAGRRDEVSTLLIISPFFGPEKSWKAVEDLDAGYGFVYTNTSGIATLCGSLRNGGVNGTGKVRCIWFDKNETDASRIVDMDFNNFDSNNIRIHSSKPGKIIFVGIENYLQNILIDRFNSDGKCRRLEEMTTGKITNLEVSINAKKEYCFAYVEDSALQINYEGNEKTNSTHPLEFVSKCIKPERSSLEIYTCGLSRDNYAPMKKLERIGESLIAAFFIPRPLLMFFAMLHTLFWTSLRFIFG